MKFYVERSLCLPDVQQMLDVELKAHLADWRRGLRLLPEHEENRDVGVAVHEGQSLHDAVLSVSPIRFGISAVNMVGAYEGVTIFMRCSRTGLPPESNMLTIEIRDISEVEGSATEDWARVFFRSFVGAVPTRYAQARTREEFEAKNMIRNKGAARAVGVNLKRALPGLYWLNFLGPDYVELMGPERVSAAPAFVVEGAGTGACIELDEKPDRWTAEDYRRREEATLAHLGREYFYSRTDSERPTKAPTFRAAREG